MDLINLKTRWWLIVLSIFLAAIFSCRKDSGSSKVLEKVDTVKYEALLNNAVAWCLSISVPPYDSISGNPADIAPFSNKTGFSHLECGNNQNDTLIFTVNKYRNASIRLLMFGSRQDTGGSPPDSSVTLNIYLNGIIVATQSSTTKDSIQYIIQ